MSDEIPTEETIVPEKPPVEEPPTRHLFEVAGTTSAGTVKAFFVATHSGVVLKGLVNATADGLDVSSLKNHGPVTILD